MERRHHWHAGERERGDADRRRDRLVQVQDVKPLLLEHAPDPRNRGGAEDDVRERVVRRDDHRASNRDHVRGRRSVPAETRVQNAREAPRRVVPHDRARLHAQLPEGLRLQLRVLDHRAPEGPRVRDDDPDFHGAQDMRATGRDYTRSMEFPGGLAELHTHLGGSVASDILWTLAHEQGIALPVKDYWEFDALVTIADPRRVDSLDALNAIYHWTELIQSSPLAVERSVHAAIGGAYRSQGITTLEVRFNPMKRNRGGERDLDHIIMAGLRGLDRAALEYPLVRAGLIMIMDRTFSYAQNEIIVDKAIRYAPRGIVGIDIAGPRPGGERYRYRELALLVEEARGAGLGITIHVGEEGEEHGIAEIREVVDKLAPERIGHGILAARDGAVCDALAEAGTVLEVCPTSNLLTRALRDEGELRDTIRTFVNRGVGFTIATDGPEMMRTHLRNEFE